MRVKKGETSLITPRHGDGPSGAGSLTIDRAMRQPSERAASPTTDRGNLPVHSETSGDWRASIRQAIRSVAQLRSFVGLPVDDEADHGFPVFVTREFASRIRRGDPHDPLLRQVLPTHAESQSPVGFGSDPVGDPAAAAAPGLLHKYDGRALILTTAACGVHCRYCFRREFDYAGHSGRSERFDGALKYLKQHDSIEEVLLSGGDPLMMTNAALFDLLDSTEAVGHVRRLRLHTRMPIVLPSRVDDELLDRLQASRLAVWIVVHVNHAAEIDSLTAAALSRMVDAGIPVLNQSVLLAGVNDMDNALVELSRRLINLRVTPYYLHQLDRVSGASHFEVDENRGLELIEAMRACLPGYAVPTLVREIAGRASKTPVGG